MNLKLRINSKMLIYVLGATLLVYVTALSYIALKLRANSYANSLQVLNSKTVEVSNMAQKRLNNYIDATQILANAFANHHALTPQNKFEMVSTMMQNTLKSEPDLLTVWTIWEPNIFDGTITNDSISDSYTNGQSFTLAYQKSENTIALQNIDLQNQVNFFRENIYHEVKQSLKPLVTEPGKFPNPQNEKDTSLQTTLVVPIIHQGEFIGVAGVDVSLSYIQDNFSKMQILETGNVFIITNNGQFLAHNDYTFHNKAFENYAPKIENAFKVVEYIQKGEPLNIESVNPGTGLNSIFSFLPIHLGKSVTKWSFCTAVPLKTIYAEANKTFRYALLVGFIGFLILTIVIFIIAKSLTASIISITNSLSIMAEGNIYKANKLKLVFNDEINDMAVSMNKLVEGLSAAARFATKIGKGQLDADYTLLSDNDTLGISLISMQKSLKIAKEAEETKKIDDEKRNWNTHGLAKFGEIIRQHNDDIAKFTMNLVNNLAEYMNAAQVAIYINQQVDDDESKDNLFELMGAVAYGKSVLLNKSFIAGQELLGRAVEENKTIMLENLPDRYVILSPGMKNEKRPNNLFITPMTINDHVLGVIEILSYQKFESFEVDFLERLAENTASVISSVKTNLRTESLLQQSQHQADELAQHEEEMRQNLEEMQATQEEAGKRQNELKAHIKALKNTIMMAELDIQGRILDISQTMSALYGGSIENMRGKYYESFVVQSKEKGEEFNRFWDDLVRDGHGKRIQQFTIHHKETYILEIFSVIHTEMQPPRVLVIALDKTKEHELNEEWQEEKKKN